MDYGAILTNSKWNLIKEIAIKEQTPTDLSKKTNTSLANVTQQLRLLEAYDLIKKERKETSRGPGKPRTTYKLKKDILNIIIVTEGLAEKKDLELDFTQRGVMNIWLHAKKDDTYLLEKYFVNHEDLLKKCQAVFIVKTTSEQIDLLIITEHINEIREKYSNKESTDLEGRKKKVVAWTHTLEEVSQGINKNEEYFLNLTSNIKPIIDKEYMLKKIIEARK